MSNFNIEEWELLAKRWANRYKSRAESICDWDDLYNIALTAIWEASKEYDESKESGKSDNPFATFCYWRLYNTMNNVVYKSHQSEELGRCALIPRVLDKPFTSMGLEMDSEDSTLLNPEPYEDDTIDSIYANQLFDDVRAKLNIKPKGCATQENIDKKLLYLDLLKAHGAEDVGPLYAKQTGATRQATYYIRDCVLKVFNEVLACY